MLAQKYGKPQGNRGIQAGDTLTINNDATVTYDPESTEYYYDIAFIHSYDADNSGYFSKDVSISGGNLKVIGHFNQEDYAVINEDTYSSNINIKGTNLDFSRIQMGIYAGNGSTSITDNDFTRIHDADIAVYSTNQAIVSVSSKNLEFKTDAVAWAEKSGQISLSASESADVKGVIYADSNGAESSQTNATVTLSFENKEDSQKTRSNKFNFTGDAISLNNGVVNISLGNGSLWTGRSDDFKDADSEEWRQEHGQEFGDVVSDLQSSGRVNVTVSDGAYWNVTGQSWVSKLDGNGTIDLRGSETGGYAIHIGEITGSNTFLVNLDKDNKRQSDMIYVYNGSGAAEQNIVISNRDEVLGSMDVGERVRFATVANASGGFISDGMTTEFSGQKSISTFGRNTQIRDAGVKNVNFKIVYESYNTDKATAEEDLGYNGGDE